MQVAAMLRVISTGRPVHCSVLGLWQPGTEAALQRKVTALQRGRRHCRQACSPFCSVSMTVRRAEDTQQSLCSASGSVQDSDALRHTMSAIQPSAQQDLLVSMRVWWSKAHVGQLPKLTPGLVEWQFCYLCSG